MTVWQNAYTDLQYWSPDLDSSLNFKSIFARLRLGFYLGSKDSYLDLHSDLEVPAACPFINSFVPTKTIALYQNNRLPHSMHVNRCENAGTLQWHCDWCFNSGVFSYIRDRDSDPVDFQVYNKATWQNDNSRRALAILASSAPVEMVFSREKALNPNRARMCDKLQYELLFWKCNIVWISADVWL